MLRSAFVTIIGSPIGRHPCDTTVDAVTERGSSTPTAPSV